MNEKVLLDFGGWTPVVAVGIVAACAGVTALCGMASLYLAHLKQNTVLARALKMLGETVVAAVADVNTGMKPRLQAAAADGKITAAEWATLVDEALVLVKKSGTSSTWRALEQVFGDTLPAWLRTVVENALGAPPTVQVPATAIPPVLVAPATGVTQPNMVAMRTGEYPTVAANPQTPPAAK